MKQTTITIVLLTITSTVSADFLGPPRAEIGQGRSGLGIEYLQSEMDLEVDGVFGLTDADIKEVEFNKINGVLRTGLSEKMDLFVRLGMAEAEVDQGANDDNLGYFIGDSDSTFNIGGGAKFTFASAESVSWGMIAQLSYVDLDFEGASGVFLGTPISIDFEAQILEFDVGIGPSLDINEDVCLYGGALLQFIEGDADVTGTVGLSSATESSDLELGSNFGGFIGGRIELADTADLAIEYQTTGDSYAFGLSLIHRFGETMKTTEREEVPKVRTNQPTQKPKTYKGTINPATGKPETRVVE